MAITGAEIGNLALTANCAGLTGSTNISTGPGSAGPNWSVNAPAALSGTITSGTVTLGATATMAGTEKVAIYWVIAGVQYYRYDCTIASGTNTTTFAVSGGTGTTLPTGGQAISLAVNQDVTDEVAMLGTNMKQLLVISTGIGLVEWLNVTPTQERLSWLPAANSFDTWPTTLGQTAPPSGWTGGDTVVTLRFWNFSSTSAVMQVGAILA